MKTRLAERIKHYRQRKGFTQSDMAKLLGVDKGTPYRWEKGLSWPDYTQLEALAHVLDVTPEHFFETVSIPAPSIAALAAEVDRQAAETARLRRDLNAAQIPALTGQKRELFDLIAGLDDAKAEGLLRLIRRTLEISGSPDNLDQPQVLSKKPRR